MVTDIQTTALKEFITKFPPKEGACHAMQGQSRRQKEVDGKAWARAFIVDFRKRSRQGEIGKAK